MAAHIAAVAAVAEAEGADRLSEVSFEPRLDGIWSGFLEDVDRGAYLGCPHQAELRTELSAG